MREWDENTETTHLYDYAPETNTKTLIASLEQVYTSAPCTFDKENFYFNHNGYLHKYNVTDKSTEVLCNIQDMGLPADAVSSCKILVNEAGEIALVDQTGEEWGIYYLTDEEVINTEKSTITFANLTEYEPVYAKQQAASFSSRSRSVSVEYENAEERNFEAYHDRMIMEPVSGKGPDIMWVSEEGNLIPYMDLAQGITYFNEQEFVDSLRICQKYGRSGGTYDNDTIVNMLHDSDSIAQLRYIYDGLIDYSAIMNQCSDKCHMVGFPTYLAMKVSLRLIIAASAEM